MRALLIKILQRGAEHPDTIEGLSEVAIHYTYDHEHERAKPFYQRAFKLWEKYLGPEHPDIYTPHYGLARTIGLMVTMSEYVHCITCPQYPRTATRDNASTDPEDQELYANFLRHIERDMEAVLLQAYDELSK